MKRKIHSRSPLPKTSEIKSSNQLRNINSFEYLLYLVNFLINTPKPTIPKKLWPVFQIVLDKTREFKKGYCYGDLYSTFMQALEDYIEEKHHNNDATIRNLVEATFINKNWASERTYAVIKPSIKKCAGKSAQIESEISSALPDFIGDEKAANDITPLARETTSERFLDSFIRDDFKPQISTSQPSVRRYKYKKANDPIELRLGTQSQRHNGEPRVSPLFEAFIEFQGQDPFRNKKSGITHVYFNALGRDSLPFSFGTFFKGKGVERSRESALTRKLEELESRHTNIAVITLPSDKGIMSHSYVKDQKVVTDPYKKLLAIAFNQSNEAVQDFYISKSIRTKLFGDDPGNELAQLKTLLSKSFKSLGFLGKKELTRAEFQAVWFYFTKYTLTNFIVDTLNPLTFQMSCKDGIDRAGVHSALYNLMKSFEPGRTPMSLEEFERAIDAAPTMVKGRGMNHHRDLLWNAINSYINANHDSLKENQDQQWLLEWHATNRPAGLPQSTKAMSFSRSPISKELTSFAPSEFRDSLFSGTVKKTGPIIMADYGLVK